MRLSLRSGVLLAGITAALVAPSAAFGDAQVRFIHTVPMLGPASLSVSGTTVGSAAYAKATKYATVPSGDVKLVVSMGGKPVLHSSHQLKSGGLYSVVAEAAKPAELHVYRDDTAAAGVARMRVIHAAPELGSPDLSVDGKVVAKDVPYTAATQYWGLPPGTHTVTVTNPSSGKPVIPPDHIPLAAGTASTVLVVGSGGEKVKAVLVSDSETAPSGAPATGLGGLARAPGPNWPLALIAAFAAGLAGLGAHRLLRGSGRRA
jgi:Domain of unknown function (DUF4397)